MQGNTMGGGGGFNPMVQASNIKVGGRGNFNEGIQNSTVNIINMLTKAYQEGNRSPKRRRKKKGQVVKDTAIACIVQGALDAVDALKSCLQIGVDLFLGAEDYLVKIVDSLMYINHCIIIAERSPKMDHELMELLEELKDAAYDAQDLLEEYVIEYHRRQSEEPENSMTNKGHKVVTSLGTRTPVINLEQMPIKLKQLSEKLEAVEAECDTFQLKEKVTEFESEFKKTRETHSFVSKPDVIGRDREKKELVTLLLSDKQDDVSVIAIVGIGGVGKTTLAQWVFHHDDAVKNHFQPKMWICVSDNLEPENFDSIRLGNKILERATGAPHNLSDLVELQRRLRKELKGKRFLLVLDDVWNEIPGKWRGQNGLRNLLSCGGKGSRIVVTTCIPNVASIMSKTQPYSLKRLSEGGCWSLFCEHAFGNPTEEAAHPNLAPIGRQIVEKCRGIPLAVITLGDLLCSERSQLKWEFVRDSEMWNLDDENENGILPTLRLSYIHLKPHLKQCFAFCAIFPQDYVIEKELVIKLWMAQGFIPTKRGMELEDSGNEIFCELVRRYFFQDDKENVEIYKRAGPYSGVYISDQSTFQMHDLMHALAHSVMEKEYRVVLNGKSEDISSRIRHVSSNGLGIPADSLRTAQKLRTYVMLKNANFQFPCEVGPFKCLRALDFVGQQDKQKVKNSQLFTSLGNLQHLRYLNLSFTLIEMLPESLTSLCFLQTLILIDCQKLRELPKEMCKLTKLRCLDITHCLKLTHMPPKIGQLNCLQELSNFIVGRTNEIACSGIGELQGLNHLRGSLRIQILKNITDANAIDVPRDTLIDKPNLTSLYLMWEDPMDVVEKLEKQVLQGLQPHQNLKKLEIFGPNFPNWMTDTTRTALVEITLSRCWRCNHLPPLGELPFLKVLVIEELKNVECVGNEFYGNEVLGGFPSLEVLDIGHMEKLKTWSGLEWKGQRAFPSLVKLKIRNCPMLSTLKFFPDIKDVNVDQGMMQSLKNKKSFEPMHQQNCNQSSFADEVQIRSQSSLQELVIQSCYKLNFSSLGHRCFSSLKILTINDSDEFAHVAHELSFLTSLEVLRLDSCYGLSSLPEGIGNLTSLQDLVLCDCPKVKSLPRELQRLSELKRLSIDRCHPCLKTRCTKDTGDDWDKIQHIPDIRFEVNHIARY